MAKKPNLPNCLPLAGGRRTGRFVTLPEALALSEKQTALSRFWTKVHFYDDNQYAKIKRLTVK